MDPLTIAAIIAAVVGSGMQYSATKKAADNAASASILAGQRQTELQKKSEQSVLDNAKQFDPAKRIENQAQYATDIAKNITGDLVSARDSGAGQLDSSAASGKVSSDYVAQKAASTAGAMDKASMLAGLSSKYRAPGKMRFEEGINRGDFLSNEAVNDSAARMRADTDARVIQLSGIPDAGKMALGNILSTAGKMYLGGQMMAPAGGVASSGGGIMGAAKPWWDITSGPQQLAGM